MKRKQNVYIYIGFFVLALVWGWLAWGVLATNGITLFNLIIVAMTAIICFVPLYKKYIAPYRHSKNDAEQGNGKEK